MIEYNQDKVLKIEFIEYDGRCELCGCKIDDITDGFKLQISDFEIELCENCLRKLHLLTLG